MKDTISLWQELIKIDNLFPLYAQSVREGFTPYQFKIILFPGSFSAAGSGTCTSCSAGQYQPAAGQDACLPCDIGYSCPQDGMVYAQPCANGTYQDTAGQSSCTPCDAGESKMTPFFIIMQWCNLCMFPYNVLQAWLWLDERALIASDESLLSRMFCEANEHFCLLEGSSEESLMFSTHDMSVHQQRHICVSMKRYLRLSGVCLECVFVICTINGFNLASILTTFQPVE